MSCKITLKEKNKLEEAIDTLRAFIDNIEICGSCITCKNWDQGCLLAEGIAPPDHIIETGCNSWEQK